MEMLPEKSDLSKWNKEELNEFSGSASSTPFTAVGRRASQVNGFIDAADLPPYQAALTPPLANCISASSLETAFFLQMIASVKGLFSYLLQIWVI